MDFLRKIFSPLLLLASITILIYTFYRSEIIWNGSNRLFYNDYYILSVIILLFSIISFFLKKNIKTYLILIFLSSFFALYLFETFMVVQKKYYYISQKKIYEKTTNKLFDVRTQYEVYNDFIKDNIPASVVLPPNNHIGTNKKIFPLSGVAKYKTINCNENGYYQIYNSDRFGFNNPDLEWEKKEIDYMLVGDSFVLGACVNQPDDIASVLRNKFDQSVLNLGMNGNGPLIQYAGLREYLTNNVKIVLWFYFEDNDLRDLQEELKSNILNKYLKDINFSQDLKSKQEEINLITKKMIDNYSKTSFVLTKFLKLYYSRQSVYGKEKVTLPAEYKIILKLANELAIKNSSKLYFVYLPEYNRYAKKNKTKQKKFDKSNYVNITNMVNELDIPIIDINKEIFEKELDPLTLFPFKLNGHYTAEGYRKVTEIIFKKSN